MKREIETFSFLFASDKELSSVNCVAVKLSRFIPRVHNSCTADRYCLSPATKWGIGMSLIQCTSPCIYQQDGQCTLVRAASQGPPNPHRCLNFVPAKISLQQSGQGLPDISHPDEL